MAAMCEFRPGKKPGQKPELFDEIHSKLISASGKTEADYKKVYESSWGIYGLALSEEFNRENMDALSFDDDGFPTANSLLDNKDVSTLIDKSIYNNYLAGKFKSKHYNLDNYNVSVEDALNFNKDNPDKVAFVIQDSDGNIKMKVEDRTDANFKIFKDQYSAMKLARGASKILSPLGITVGHIVGEESKIRNGAVDFSRAQEALDGSDSFIRLANNLDGAKALGEEISHVIIGVRRNDPLISRLIDTLSKNDKVLKEILGDLYEDTVRVQNGDMTNVAEEALGQLLHLYLVENTIVDEFGNGTVANLFSRLRNNLIGKFKGHDVKEIADLVNSVETVLSPLAKSFLNSTLNITNEDIAKSRKDVTLNDLTRSAQQADAALQKILGVEDKRLSMMSTRSDDSRNVVLDVIDKVEYGIESDDINEKISAISKVASFAMTQLSYRLKELNNMEAKSLQEKMHVYNKAKSFLISFETEINAITEAAAELEREKDPDNFLYQKVKVTLENGKVVETTLNESIKNLNNYLRRLKSDLTITRIPLMKSFLKEYLGDSMTDEEIEKLVKSTGNRDISFQDMWFDNMASSSDSFLQSMELARRMELENARLKAIDKFREIQEFMLEAEAKGITEFDWMFETDENGKKTGFYISEYNYGKYEAESKAEYDKIREELGTNLTRAQKEEKKKRIQKWHEEHSEIDPLGNIIGPNESYRNTQYDIIVNGDRKWFLEKYLEMKRDLETVFPASQLHNYAIQIRKDGVQRFFDAMSDPSTIWTSVKEGWKSITAGIDNEFKYGDQTTSQLTDFDGRAFNILPIYYNNKMSNTDELSTDVFRALMAYTVSAYEYEALDRMTDAAKIGEDIIENDRQYSEYKGDKKVVERAGGRELESVKQDTNARRKYIEWELQHLYGKKLSDGTVFNIPIIGEVNSNELARDLMSLSASTQLAFNYFANLANVVTGSAMVNIEAAAGKFFTARQLAAADAAYAEMIPSFFFELESRIKTNKMALFCELFNVKFNFDKAGKESKVPSVLKRLLGEEWAYMGQDGGDHWLYTRVAIAMAMNEKVKTKDGEEKSLWDVLEIKDHPTAKGQKIMAVQEGVTNLEGKAFDIRRFSLKVGQVDIHLFGNYNDKDRVQAQRYVAGNLVLLYRRWIKPQFNIRFQSKQDNLLLGTSLEGYWAHVVRMLRKGEDGKRKLFEGNFTDDEKSDIKRALVEVLQLVAVIAGSALISSSDKDKHRYWAAKMTEYILKREVHELGNLTPSFIMARELKSTVTNPTSALPTISNLIDLTASVLDPTDWNNTITSGKYKGMSTLEKRIMKAPIKPIQWYNRLNDFLYDVDGKISYYDRVQNQ